MSHPCLLQLREDLHTSSPVPLHHRIYLALRAFLDLQDLRPGEELPRQVVLADFLHISRPTVKQAMQCLAADGLVSVGFRRWNVPVTKAHPTSD